MFGVLAHGLPSVALPQSADNFINANLLTGAGAAITLMPGEVTGAAVEAALRTVLRASTYREQARKLADEIAAMPSADYVAAELRF